jgi:hypothetical protein
VVAMWCSLRLRTYAVHQQGQMAWLCTPSALNVFEMQFCVVLPLPTLFGDSLHVGLILKTNKRQIIHRVTPVVKSDFITGKQSQEFLNNMHLNRARTTVLMPPLISSFEAKTLGTMLIMQCS